MRRKQKPAYAAAEDIHDVELLRGYLCEQGPDGCIGCESPCRYGVRYWKLCEARRKAAKKELAAHIAALMAQIAALEDEISRRCSCKGA